MINENISNEELNKIQPDSPDYKRAMAIKFLRFSKAVNATVLELNDLFEATRLKEEPMRVVNKNKCPDCTKFIHCVDHINKTDRKEIYSSLYVGMYSSNYNSDNI